MLLLFLVWVLLFIAWLGLLIVRLFCLVWCCCLFVLCPFGLFFSCWVWLVVFFVCLLVWFGWCISLCWLFGLLRFVVIMVVYLLIVYYWLLVYSVCCLFCGLRLLIVVSWWLFVRVWLRLVCLVLFDYAWFDYMLIVLLYKGAYCIYYVVFYCNFDVIVWICYLSVCLVLGLVAD